MILRKLEANVSSSAAECLATLLHLRRWLGLQSADNQTYIKHLLEYLRRSRFPPQDFKIVAEGIDMPVLVMGVYILTRQEHPEASSLSQDFAEIIRNYTAAKIEEVFSSIGSCITTVGQCAAVTAVVKNSEGIYTASVMERC